MRAPSGTLPLAKWCIRQAQMTDAMGTVPEQNEEPVFLEFPRVPATEAPVDGVVSKDLVVDEACGVWLRLFLPVEAQEAASERAFPVVVYFHGGGFVTCSPDTGLFDQLCRTLAKDCQVIVASGEYRKAPEFKYPVPYDDALKTVKWLQVEHEKCLPPSADVSHCFLMGDSAGANIAHYVGVMAAECAPFLTPVSIVGHILLVPFFGGEERTSAELTLFPELLTVDNCDRCWKEYLPVHANRDHPGCRVLGPGHKDLTQTALPPSLVVIAGQDVCRDWGIRYCEDLKRYGKQVQMEVFESADHPFHCMGGPLVPTLFATIKTFIGRHTV